MRRARASAFAVALLSACSPTIAPLVPPEGARSLLFVMEVGLRLEVVALDLASPTAVVPDTFAAEGAALTAIFYAAPLTELGLAPGAVPLVAMGGRPLPPDRLEVQAAVLASGGAEVWQRPCEGLSVCPAVDDPRLRIAAIDVRACAAGGGCVRDGARCQVPCIPTPPTRARLDAPPPAPPRFACPAGWIARDDPRAPDLTACTPIDRASCAATEAAFPDGCRALCTGTAPPAGAIAVDPDTLAAALVSAAPGATLRLAPGRYAGDLVLASDVRLLGACPDRTVLAGRVSVSSGALTDLAVDGSLTVTGPARLGGVELRGPLAARAGARIDAAQLAITGSIALDRAQLVLDAAVIDGPLSAAGATPEPSVIARARLSAGTSTAVRALAGAALEVSASALVGTVEADAARISLVGVRAFESGVVAQSGATVVMSGVWLERPLRWGVVVRDRDTRAELTDVVVMDAGRDEGALRTVGDPRLLAERVHLQGGRGRGLAIVGDGEVAPPGEGAEVRDLRVWDVGDQPPGAPREPFNCGVCALLNGELVLERADVRGVTHHGLWADVVRSVEVTGLRVRDVTAQLADHPGPAGQRVYAEGGTCVRLVDAAVRLRELDLAGCVSSVFVSTHPGGESAVSLSDLRVGPNVSDAPAWAIRVDDATVPQLERVELEVRAQDHGLDVRGSAMVTVRDLTLVGARAEGQETAGLLLQGTSDVVDVERFDVRGMRYGVALGGAPDYRLREGRVEGEAAALCVPAALALAEVLSGVELAGAVVAGCQVAAGR